MNLSPRERIEKAMRSIKGALQDGKFSRTDVENVKKFAQEGSNEVQT